MPEGSLQEHDFGTRLRPCVYSSPLPIQTRRRRSFLVGKSAARKESQLIFQNVPSDAERGLQYPRNSAPLRMSALAPIAPISLILPLCR